MMQILILCHNKKYAQFIQRGLAYENIASDFCEIPEDKNVPLRHLSKDAFLIMSKNPQTDLFLTKTIRDYKKTAPIILLVEEYGEDFDFKARQAGCDLLFTRPFSFSDIALQTKYLVYASKNTTQDRILKAGPFKLDISKRMLFKDEKLINLRNKEFALLELLMINKNRVLSRSEIFENIWDRNAEISTNTVDVHISSLRRKIDTDPKNPFIKTVNCIGYLFDAV